LQEIIIAEDKFGHDIGAIKVT